MSGLRRPSVPGWDGWGIDVPLCNVPIGTIAVVRVDLSEQVAVVLEQLLCSLQNRAVDGLVLVLLVPHQCRQLVHSDEAAVVHQPIPKRPQLCRADTCGADRGAVRVDLVSPE